MNVYISNSASNLRSFLENYGKTATVEAEYGDETIIGSVLTLAHHGKNTGNPPPCVYENEHAEVEAIGVSHMDLDSLGGVLSIMGRKPIAPEFWELAGWVDVNGAHKLVETNKFSKKELDRLYAWWAWSEGNRLYAPRDGTVKEITDWVTLAGLVVGRIIANDPALIDAGQKFQDKEKELNKDSYVDTCGDVVIRAHDSFVNHLYSTPFGRAYRAVVSLKNKTGEITISLANPIGKLSCKEFAQSLWGKDAGGHDGIAGGPRSGGFSLEDLGVVAEKFAQAIVDELLK